MIKDVELAIVGAGPAGIEAAIMASQAGVDVTLIDSSPTPGGQYFQQPPESFLQQDHGEHHARAQQLFKGLSSSRVSLLPNTLVWGLFAGSQPGNWCLTLHGPYAPARLNARAVILATGAFDRSIPFPGWDLPGVITAGAALRLVKHQRILPGKRVMLSGTGPLLLSAAAHLVKAGAEVITVCESSTNLPWRSLPHITAAWGQWARAKEGFDYLITLARTHVPYRLGWAVTSARGENRVGEVAIAKLDHASRPIPDSEIIYSVDALVVGYGLTPGTELCRVVDCEFDFEEQRGGFVPCRNDNLETSCPGIYAAGDCAGVGGAEMARVEGRIAGCAAAARLDHMADREAHARISREKASLHRERRFARMLGDLFSLPAGLYALAEADTTVCRCEQVTLGQLREAIRFGAQTVTDIKNLTRIGMGNCQGRTCGSITARILAAETGRAMESAGYFSVRPPIHPLPLSVIQERAEDSDPLPGEVPQDGRN